ncbi:hypothetical protein FACHB389_06065 [Nostoc calcicola FACHB-389]|nr:hypothetical protein FACHB389_06065 [Nostoc calcicola FACHB-389]
MEYYLLILQTIVTIYISNIYGQPIFSIVGSAKFYYRVMIDPENRINESKLNRKYKIKNSLTKSLEIFFNLSLPSSLTAYANDWVRPLDYMRK